MIFGIVWGLVILNLDRFLVISMESTRDVKRLVGIAIPRLLMAVVVSLVVSTPITLEIFHNDIYATMTTMNLTQSTQVANDEGNSALQREVNTLQGKITADQQILDGKLPDNVTECPAADRSEPGQPARVPGEQRAKQAEDQRVRDVAVRAVRRRRKLQRGLRQGRRRSYRAGQGDGLSAGRPDL